MSALPAAGAPTGMRAGGEGIRLHHASAARYPAPVPVATAASLAAMLDRLADLELQHGHTGAAELLAHRAAALREAGR